VVMETGIFLLAIDFPGHGRSDYSDTYVAGGETYYIVHIVGLLSVLRWDRFAVIGVNSDYEMFLNNFSIQWVELLDRSCVVYSQRKYFVLFLWTLSDHGVHQQRIHQKFFEQVSKGFQKKNDN